MFFEDAKVRETLLFTMPNALSETSKKARNEARNKNLVSETCLLSLCRRGGFWSRKVNNLGPLWGTKVVFGTQKG